MDLKIEYLNPSELKPYENNARKHGKVDIEGIKASIQEFGFNDPIGVWKDNIIIEGHGRLMAAQALGMEKVPVIRLDKLTDDQRRAYTLAHNKTAELSAWDFEKLEKELAEIDIDMTEFGFDLPEADTKVVEDDPPEIDESAEPTAKMGQVWRLGKHLLMCGDSTKLADVQKLTDGVLVDMFLTDPPYNVAYEGKTKDKLTIQNDSMGDGDFRQFLVNAFSAANEVMKPGAVFYIWHADSEGYNFRGACHDVGWKVRECLIWNKNCMVMGRQDYQWKHEPCLYGWKEGTHLWASDRKQTTVIDMARPAKAEIHPTMKPVALFDYQIKNNTKGGDIVLDLFNGSGTTIMACEQNGRCARCMELDPKYVDAAIKRWEDFTGQKAELIKE